MRRLAAMLAAVVLLTALVAVTPVAALSSAKVVIVVGPVGTLTDHYRSDAESAATAARTWSANVVTIYSPNATWSAVSKALQGASIVVYMGHGNGFPSPYSSTLMGDRQDGMGLNPVAGVDDTANTYRGESYIAADVRLAPGALVILGHLCYSAGAGEPGQATPTLSVARQRVDNFAAGWVKAGARAVVSDATYGQAAYYIDSAFSTTQTLESAFLAASTDNGNAMTFPSVRQPGFVDELDPDTPTGNYHRSIVFAPGATTSEVVGGAPASPVLQPTPQPALPGPQTAGFLVPAPAGRVTTSRTNTISWTASDPSVASAAVGVTEEVVRAVGAACPTDGWQTAWTIAHGSPFRIAGFAVGYCYRYRVADGAAAAAPLASGTLRIAPAPSVRFVFPRPGRTTAAPTTNTISWSVTVAAGAPRIASTTLLEQFGRPVVAGSCSGVAWRTPWSRAATSPLMLGGFSHRTCYRYRATTRDAAGVASLAWSGPLYVR